MMCGFCCIYCHFVRKKETKATRLIDMMISGKCSYTCFFFLIIFPFILVCCSLPRCSLSDQRSVVENLIENLVETMTVVIVVTVEGLMTVGAGIVIGIMIGIVMTGNALETQIALMILEIVTVHAHGQQTMNVQGTMIVTSTVQ